MAPLTGAGARAAPPALLARLLPQLLLLLLLALAGAARAQAPGALERQVKAAYLYKFAGFVEWPEGSFARPDSALVIGVLGADALAEQLEQSVAGHTAGGRAIVVRKLRRGEALAGLHILFIGAMERAALQEALAASRGQALLTVSDSDEAHALGSMVNFVVADDKLRFEVALKPVASARMRISARMLSAAYKVQGAS
jgi:hypothetical protein